MDEELKQNIYRLMQLFEIMTVEIDGEISDWKWSEEEGKPVRF